MFYFFIGGDIVFAGQRRSSRLAESPRVFNQVKKRQAYVDLGEKDHSPIQDEIRRIPRAEPKTNVHDIRLEMNLVRDKRAPISQDDDDFVTPLKRLIESERHLA